MEKPKRIITAKETIELQKKKAERIPQELRQGIDDIKGIYSDELIEYLEALLSFEINIVNDNTYDEERLQVLKRLKLFRRLVDYNVFEYAKKIIRQTDERIEISERYFEYFPNFEANYNVYTEYSKTLFRTSFINEKGESKISFTVYQTEKNDEKIDERLEELYKIYNKEKQTINPIQKDNNIISSLDPHYLWQEKQNEKIYYYRNLIKEIKARRNLNDSEQIEQELGNKIYNNLKKEYGPFSEEPGIIESEKAEVKEYCLVKKTPFVNIYTIKKYY